MLVESSTLIGKVVTVDSTHIEAYRGRAMDNVSGRSDPDAGVGRGRRGFILGYRDGLLRRLGAPHRIHRRPVQRER
jgi:hypothetical protein